MAVVATVAVVLGLLVVVLELAAEDCACEGTENTVATHLVAAKVSGSTATQSAHQAAVTFLLHGRVATAILLSRLAMSVLALRVLILPVGTLLRELVLRLRAGVAALLILTGSIVSQDCFETSAWLVHLPLLLLIVVVVLAALLLTMLEATLCGRAVL